jgi:hypothetical protein
MSINVFCSCCFYYLIRMGNNPESKISKKNIAKKIIRGVLTLSFFPFAKNPLPSLLQETKRSPARYYFSQKRVRAPVHCETVGMRFLLARNSFSQNVQNLHWLAIIIFLKTCSCTGAHRKCGHADLQVLRKRIICPQYRAGDPFVSCSPNPMVQTHYH